MTIAAGFRFNEGILLCADRQYTGQQKVYKTKLFPGSFGDLKVVLALAGSDSYGAMAADEIAEAIAECKDHSLRAIKKEIKRVVKRSHEQYVDTRPEAERESARFQFVIGLWHKNEGLRLLRSMDAAVAPVTDWICVGTGDYLAGYLLKSIYNANMSLDSGVAVAAQTLAAVKQYDSFAGGRSEMLQLRLDGSMSQPVSMSIPLSEVYMGKYESASRKIMLSLADLDLDEAQFASQVDTFAANLKAMRKKWHYFAKTLAEIEQWTDKLNQATDAANEDVQSSSEIRSATDQR